jgi:hypothetical protein
LAKLESRHPKSGGGAEVRVNLFHPKPLKGLKKVQA